MKFYIIPIWCGTKAYNSAIRIFSQAPKAEPKRVIVEAKSAFEACNLAMSQDKNAVLDKSVYARRIN